MKSQKIEKICENFLSLKSKLKKDKTKCRAITDKKRD